MNVKNSQLVFWSDYCAEELFDIFNFVSIDLIRIEKAERYDGIYNIITCYKYTIRIEQDLSVMTFN